MNYEFIKTVKHLAVIAIASDDDLMEMLVLKGGSAIEMIYKVNNRASLDLDFSMEDGLNEEQIAEIGDKLYSTFSSTFEEYGYEVFDSKFMKKPKQELSEEHRKFWGGYKFEFKLADKEKYEGIVTKTDKEAENLLNKKRREAYTLGKSNSTKFIRGMATIATKSAVQVI